MRKATAASAGDRWIEVEGEFELGEIVAFEGEGGRALRAYTVVEIQENMVKLDRALERTIDPGLVLVPYDGLPGGVLIPEVPNNGTVEYNGMIFGQWDADEETPYERRMALDSRMKAVMFA